MEAHWVGADTGAMHGPASARWCADQRYGEVLGMHGDTGVGIAIRQADSLASGHYSAVLPDSADTSAASATVALRFLGRTTVAGYQSDSGTVTLERDAEGRLGASFDVRARAVGTVARITLRGRASAVPIAVGGEECTAP